MACAAESGRATERRLWARFAEHGALKLRVLLALPAGIWAPYAVLQRLDLFPARSVPLTWLDEEIAFEPAWIWAYASVYLMVPLAPLLADESAQLRRYARGLVLLCGVSFAVFLLAPMNGPRPEASAPESALYAWIIACDRPANALPSLHAGLTLYSLLFADRVLRGSLDRRSRLLCNALGLLWGGLILYSTLATKQHQAWDLPAGMLLSWAAHFAAWRTVDAQRSVAAL